MEFYSPPYCVGTVCSPCIIIIAIRIKHNKEHNKPFVVVLVSLCCMMSYKDQSVHRLHPIMYTQI